MRLDDLDRLDGRDGFTCLLLTTSPRDGEGQVRGFRGLQDLSTDRARDVQHMPVLFRPEARPPLRLHPPGLNPGVGRYADDPPRA